MPAFVVPHRPKSVNSGKTGQWEDLVRDFARTAWTQEPPHDGGDLRVTIVFLFDHEPIDVDNIVKPILDALKGVCYGDDSFVTDVDSHRRSLAERFDLEAMPNELIRYLGGAQEVVYIQVRPAGRLEDYLT